MNLCYALLLWTAIFPALTGTEDRLRLEYDDLVAQASALIDATDHMEADLRQQGLVLHPDIAIARNRLATAIDRATTALDNQDWNQLRKRLDRARGYAEQLRRKLL
ncbi:MAG TPA: hypothetical protein VKZ53_08850 [Candidatus Angelobacter sp.]|nr:hypothetical protein [Candidatus Angelobacter sp.]